MQGQNQLARISLALSQRLGIVDFSSVQEADFVSDCILVEDGSFGHNEKRNNHWLLWFYKQKVWSDSCQEMVTILRCTAL